ncbi:hypothetical protein [Micromonospora psammae]|uniref:hypothetical protein n=1 Tax=Micromonospora sp. CPCC 205556 TaxID=3122398 RepID=UPI002FEFE03F
MSVQHGGDGATPATGAAPERCRQPESGTYRCACGQVRDSCVRDTVHALWSDPDPDPEVRPARPAPS